MAKVMMGAVMSVDGFIADVKGGVGPLFEWYNNGDVEMYGADPDRSFHISQVSYDFVKPLWDQCMVVVIGRRLFDLTNGWHGVPPVGEAVIVVTHQPPTDWDFSGCPVHLRELSAGGDRARDRDGRRWLRQRERG